MICSLLRIGSKIWRRSQLNFQSRSYAAVHLAVGLPQMQKSGFLKKPTVVSFSTSWCNRSSRFDSNGITVRSITASPKGDILRRRRRAASGLPAISAVMRTLPVRCQVDRIVHQLGNDQAALRCAVVVEAVSCRSHPSRRHDGGRPFSSLSSRRTPVCRPR